MTRISAIIPAHNEEDVLSRAVQSVLSQSISDFELIIVDDCSTDNTFDLANSFDDPRIKTFKHHTNRGGSAARNTAMINTDSDYYAFLDADDEWMSTKLERQIKRLESLDESYVATYCDVRYHPSPNRIINFLSEYLIRSDIPKEGGEELIPYILSEKFFLGGSSTLLVRSSVVDEMGGFIESFERHQDWEFLIRLLKNGEVSYIDEKLVKKYDTGTPSPESAFQAKKSLLDTFENDIKDAENAGFEVIDRHQFSLVKYFTIDQQYSKALDIFYNMENRSVLDYARFGRYIINSR